MSPHAAECCVRWDVSIQQAIARMDANRRGVVLVIDERQRLLGTVTDGDIRRAILARLNLEAPITLVLDRKIGTPYVQPITAPAGTDPESCLRLLRQHDILHLPLVDAESRVVDLVCLEEVVSDRSLPLQAVVMAGGQGRRLAPLTEEVPKPMLKVGDRPLLETIIAHLRDAGITEVTITTHHQADKITAHFGDGSQFGVKLSYVEEDQPLGTVGGLGRMGVPKTTTLLINGDILTQVNFRAMLLFHREHQADLTVAVRHYDMRVPYGVVECEGPTVRRISEKPVVGLFVNAGIYLLEPVVYHSIPKDQPCDMPDLVHRLLEAKRSVVSFPIREYWLDIGQPEDYEQAQETMKQWEAAGS